MNIQAINAEQASQQAQPTLEMLSKKMGRIPNMYQVMANSPATLSAFVKFNSELSTGTLGHQMSEMIALATAESNGCSYCLSAHSFLGKKVGLTDGQMLEGRSFYSKDEKMMAGLAFAKKIMETPKELSGNDLEPLRAAGYSDGDILEIVANVIKNMLTNYINILAGTELDWPVVVEPLKSNLKQQSTT